MKKGDKVFVEAELRHEYGSGCCEVLVVGASQGIMTHKSAVFQSMEDQLVRSPLMTRLRQAEDIINSLQTAEKDRVPELRDKAIRYCLIWKPKQVENIFNNPHLTDEFLKKEKAKWVDSDRYMFHGVGKVHHASEFDVGDIVKVEGKIKSLNGAIATFETKSGECKITSNYLTIVKKAEKAETFTMTKEEMKKMVTDWAQNNRTKSLTADTMWSILTKKE